METARYGRMRLGRCVKNDLGYVGCFTDVLDLVDSRCSGKSQCEFQIPDPELDKLQPCLEDLKSYLEASYRCVKGESQGHFLGHLCFPTPFCLFVKNVISITTLVYTRARERFPRYWT